MFHFYKFFDVWYYMTTYKPSDFRNMKKHMPSKSSKQKDIFIYKLMNRQFDFFCENFKSFLYKM